jgi:Raf kinase inhibitor-like YbhB/YbcL family protein
MQPHIRSQPHELHVSSPSFRQGSAIPVEHTADGAGLPPELAWSKAPPGTQSFAILVDDPDAPDPAAPRRIFTHWIVVGLPPHATSLRGGLPLGASCGTNDLGQRAWTGPNPPVGRHRYFFRVWALDIMLHTPGITRLELLAAIKDHVLAEGAVVGTYGR